MNKNHPRLLFKACNQSFLKNLCLQAAVEVSHRNLQLKDWTIEFYLKFYLSLKQCLLDREKLSSTNVLCLMTLLFIINHVYIIHSVSNYSVFSMQSQPRIGERLSSSNMNTRNVSRYQTLNATNKNLISGQFFVLFCGKKKHEKN